MADVWGKNVYYVVIDWYYRTIINNVYYMGELFTEKGGLMVTARLY
jgi:hypothetical protein